MTYKHEEKEIHSYIRETETDGLRTWFIRLVDRGSVNTDEIKSFTFSDLRDFDATLDFDENDELIGVALTIFKEEDAGA